MPRFFLDNVDGRTAVISGADAAHIVKVLRMRPGERLTVCDLKGTDYECEITNADPGQVELIVLEARPSRSEPGTRVTLYQGLPKADKMEWIVQKSVELGVRRIVPVLTARCVSRPDDRSMDRKLERWNRIAAEAAKQCGRAILPEVAPALEFKEAARELSGFSAGILFYEKCGTPLKQALEGAGREIGILIGPEGGFEQEEADCAASLGVRLSGLGPRILRTETAPLCAISCIMYETGNL